MGKKGKEKKIRRKKWLGNPAWIGGLIALVGIGWFAWRGVATDRAASLAPAGPASTSGYVRREKGTPLSPALFVGKTAVAYQVAHEIPDVLDQLYCYCECDRHMRHASLLSCFVDSHAAT